MAMKYMSHTEINSSFTRLRELAVDLDGILPIVCASMVHNYFTGPHAGNNAQLNGFAVIAKKLKGVVFTQYLGWLRQVIPAQISNNPKVSGEFVGKKLKGKLLTAWLSKAEGTDTEKFLKEHPDFREYKKEKLEVAVNKALAANFRKRFEGVLRDIKGEVAEGMDLDDAFIKDAERSISALIEAITAAEERRMKVQQDAETIVTEVEPMAMAA